MAALCLFLTLVACSPSASPTAGNAPVTSEQHSIAPISVTPPGAADRPLAPGQSGTEYMPNGLPALAPSKGVNADLMFAENIRDEVARFKRLENAVSDLRREFEAVKPAIIRLAAVESDMEQLVTQLQSLVGPPTGNDAMADSALPPPQPLIRPTGNVNIHDDGDIPDIGPREIGAMSDSAAAELMEKENLHRSVQTPQKTAKKAAPKAEPVAPKPSQPAAAPQTVTTGPAVLGVRVGEHAHKTRIVIDVTARTAFMHNLDNAEGVLMIELPDAAWIGQTKDKIAKSPLVAGWQSASDGHILAVQLKDKVDILSASSLQAKGDAPFRIIFDLKKAP